MEYYPEHETFNNTIDFNYSLYKPHWVSNNKKIKSTKMKTAYSTKVSKIKQFSRVR